MCMVRVNSLRPLVGITMWNGLYLNPFVRRKVKYIPALRQIDASSENMISDFKGYNKIGQGIYFFLDFGPLIWAANRLPQNLQFMLVGSPSTTNDC